MATLTTYIVFIREVVGIDEADLPDTSDEIKYSYCNSESKNKGTERYYDGANCFPLLGEKITEYDRAVYNLAAHYLIVNGTEEILQKLKADAGANALGRPTSTSNGASSTSYTLPTNYQNSNWQDSNIARTEWGRNWLEINSQIRGVMFGG